MKIQYILARAATSVVVLWLIALSAAAQNYPAPKEGTWIARDFRFQAGEVMPELRVHYRTVGEPSGEPVLILHGTTRSGLSLLSPVFAGELFGPGQPLDASKYYIILPDGIGHGKTAKPSDGLRAKFPRYNYDDMVVAQYRLVTEGLGLRHLRIGARLFDGRHARLDVGREISGFHGCVGADGVSAHRDVQPQLDDAAADYRQYPQRPGVEQRQLHCAAALCAGGQRFLRHRHQRRHVGVIRRWHPHAKRPTRWSTTAWLRPLQPMPTTFFMCGSHRAITIRRPDWNAFRPRCWRSIRRTTSAIRRKPALWSVNSSA